MGFTWPPWPPRQNEFDELSRHSLADRALPRLTCKCSGCVVCELIDTGVYEVEVFMEVLPGTQEARELGRTRELEGIVTFGHAWTDELRRTHRLLRANLRHVSLRGMKYLRQEHGEGRRAYRFRGTAETFHEDERVHFEFDRMRLTGSPHIVEMKGKMFGMLPGHYVSLTRPTGGDFAAFGDNWDDLELFGEQTKVRLVGFEPAWDGCELLGHVRELHAERIG